MQVICPQLCETERLKNTKETAMKFDVWSGVRDLSFIIPKNFNNLGQKSGSRTAGAAAGVTATGGAAAASARGGRQAQANEEDVQTGRKNDTAGF